MAIFWTIAIALATACAAILVRTLIRDAAAPDSSAACDLRVYRDQLREIDRDVERGTVDPEEAERMRAEVQRRILAADARMRETAAAGRPRPGAALAAALVAAPLIGGSLLVYGWIGRPGMQDLPLAQRIAESDAMRASRLTQAQAESLILRPQPAAQPDAETGELMRRLREAVAERPNDLAGLALLAGSEASLGNLAAAHDAQRRLVDAKGAGATGADHARLAELLAAAAGGYVSVEAEQAVREALRRDPRQPLATYLLGAYMLQVDRPDAAFRLWEPLLRDAAAEPRLRRAVRADIAAVAWRAGVRYDLPDSPADPGPGPSVEDIEAAARMGAQERAEMVRGMVEGLAARLEANGGSPEEWGRLAHARSVLGETAQAREALAKGRGAFAGDAAALATLREWAVRAGLEP